MDNAVGLQPYLVADYSDRSDSRNTGARRSRPVGALIHSTSGVDSLGWLTAGAARAGSPASANVLIDKDGFRYVLCGPDRYPYHAGVSYYFDGIKALDGDAVSEAFLGVELEYLNSEEPTYAQYDSCAEYLAQQAIVWNWRWPYIILGHYSVARPLGRRSDPCNFDWGSFMGRLYVWSLVAKIPGLV